MPRIDSYTNLDNTTLATDDEFVLWDTSASQVANVPLSALDERFVAPSSQGANASTVQLATRVAGDTFNRLEILADGTVNQGDGTTVPTPPVTIDRWRIDNVAETMTRGEVNSSTCVLQNQRLHVTNFWSPINKTVSQAQFVSWGRGTTVDQVQTLTMTGTPTGGTFTLSFGGQTTAPIAFNATAAIVRDAMKAAFSNMTCAVAGFPTAVADNITVAGGPFPGTAITVTFKCELGATTQTLMTASSAGLTGGTTPTVTPSITTAAVGPTMAKVGLYEYNPAYDATLIASSAHSPYLFASAFQTTGNRVSFTSSVTLQRGKLYGLGVLYTFGGTLPSLVGQSTGADILYGLPTPPMTTRVDAQADLPISVTRAFVLGYGVYWKDRYYGYVV